MACKTSEESSYRSNLHPKWGQLFLNRRLIAGNSKSLVGGYCKSQCSCLSCLLCRLSECYTAKSHIFWLFKHFSTMLLCMSNFSESLNLASDKKLFGLRHYSKFKMAQIATDLQLFGNFKLLVKWRWIIKVLKSLFIKQAVWNCSILCFSAEPLLFQDGVRALVWAFCVKVSQNCNK